MSDNEIHLAREVSLLKAEVRRLRRLIEGSLLLLGLAAIVLYPGILVLVASFCILCLFAFLVSPVRRLIFRPGSADAETVNSEAWRRGNHFEWEID